MPPLPAIAALLPDSADPTPLPDTVPLDPPAVPYPKEGLPALLKDVGPKLESPKTISAEKERPPEPIPVKAFPPDPPAPELRSWARGEVKPPKEWAICADEGWLGE